MKLYQDYKKLFNFILVILVLSMPILFSSAQTKEELNEKIENTNNEINKLEQEISKYQSELNNLGKQKSSLSNSIKELDLTKKKLETDLAVTQKKIDKTNLEIKTLGSQIINKEDLISNNQKSIASGIKKTYELEQNYLIEILLSENGFSSIWNEIDSILSVREEIRKEIGELKETKIVLEDTRNKTIKIQKELASLKNKLSDQKKIVDQNTAEKKKLLNATKNNEANYQKLVKERLAKKEAFEKEVSDYESQLKFILDPKSLPGKNVLSWPLDNILITQLFGITKDSLRLYTSGSHSGVDFRASVGTPVKAVADGIVAGTGDTDLTCPYASFGKFIFIKHNNGLSTAYGHLSLIKVSEGQKVSRGQTIGYSGNTGHTTGPHLHLTVYAADAAKMESRPSKACGGKNYRIPVAATNAYLDPMIYLPPYTKSMLK